MENSHCNSWETQCNEWKLPSLSHGKYPVKCMEISSVMHGKYPVKCMKNTKCNVLKYQVQ